MRRKSSLSALRWVSLAFIVSAAILAVLQLISFSRIRENFPAGMSIASIPVGGLDHDQAAQRILQVYATPIEIHYGEAVIQIKPSTLGFDLNMEGMLAASDLQRLSRPFWLEFWDGLWNRPVQKVDIPLVATISKERLQTYLQEEIATRYDTPPSEAVPIAGSVNFAGGKAGTVLNVDRAVPLIEDALNSPTNRIVDLSYNQTNAPRPSFQNLEILLKQIFETANFDGIAEFYLVDLQNMQEIHFTYQSGVEQPPAGDIAFSAESTIKIPIMISIYRRTSLPLSTDLAEQMRLMIDESNNVAPDTMMDAVMGASRGPLEVTKDLQAIGLQNTFLGAMMSKPIFLQKLDTPANKRTDVVTDPDKYNQTTATDMGMLLTDVYQCAQLNGGSLIAAFNGDITQAKCQDMVNYLANNKIGALFQRTLPDGTRFAHKHAWANTNDGLIHTIGDAGIAYTPGGNYVISGFMYNATQLVYEPTNVLFGQLSLAVYNYYNQITQ